MNAAWLPELIDRGRRRPSLRQSEHRSVLAKPGIADVSHGFHVVITSRVIDFILSSGNNTLIFRRSGGSNGAAGKRNHRGVFSQRDGIAIMHRLNLHTIETAPEKSRPTLQNFQHHLGFLPNAIATMAGSPVLLNAFAAVFSGFHGGSFDDRERQALLLTNAVTLRCPWTVAAHSTFALEHGMAAGDVAAMRAGLLPENPNYAALSGLTRALLEKRGHAGEAEIERFTAAGYASSLLLEVITALAISTLAATTANLAGSPLDARFEAQAWAAP
jgi:alkylhydroperoxidase family enzyme